MCYSGLCAFEDHNGDCTAPGNFRERYGLTPCIVGGGFSDPDDERWAKEHADEINIARISYFADMTN